MPTSAYRGLSTHLLEIYTHGRYSIDPFSLILKPAYKLKIKQLIVFSTDIRLFSLGRKSLESHVHHRINKHRPCSSGHKNEGNNINFKLQKKIYYIKYNIQSSFKSEYKKLQDFNLWNGLSMANHNVYGMDVLTQMQTKLPKPYQNQTLKPASFIQRSVSTDRNLSSWLYENYFYNI